MKQRGFTLIELMVALVVLAVFINVALPGFTNMIKDNRVQASQRTMLSAINLARSEASHRNQVVTMAAVNGSWSEGIRIYTDNDAAGNTAFTAGTDTLIKDIGGSSDTDLEIKDDGNAFISFRGNGMLNEGGNTVSIGICDDRGASHGRAITISLVGRPSITDNVNCFN